MGRNQSVGKIGKDGSQAPAIDLYRRQVISTWSLTVTMDFFSYFKTSIFHIGCTLYCSKNYQKYDAYFLLEIMLISTWNSVCIIDIFPFPTLLMYFVLQIARQDNKKERKHQKEIKNQTDAQATNSKLFREMVVVLFTLLTIFLVVYSFLYLSVQNRNRDNSE